MLDLWQAVCLWNMKKKKKISAMHPIVDGITIYAEMWTVVDKDTGVEIPMSELPDDDEPIPTSVKQGSCPLSLKQTLRMLD